MQRVTVIGAGVGGLAAAIELAARGVSVEVLEAADHVGGKIQPVMLDGLRLDTGPTVLTMLWVFEELFASTGANLTSYVRPEKLERIARHIWSDGTHLDLFADVEQSARAIASVFGEKEAERYRAFCIKNRELYNVVREPFLLSQKPSVFDVMRPKYRFGLDWATKIEAHRSMMASLERSFREPKLRQLFGRYATYCGSSPWHAPATLNVIAHVEQEGVWVVEGGMAALAEGLRRRAEELGVRFHLGATVDGVRSMDAGKWAVRLATGDEVVSEGLLFNTDAAAAGALIQSTDPHLRAPAPAERSLSAVTWAAVARASGTPLVKHTVVFSDDYGREFREIFQEGRLPVEPTVYLCASDRDETGSAPGGRERLFLIVNAPATGDKGLPTDEDVEECEARVLERLARCGVHLEFKRKFERTLGFIISGFP